MSALVIAFEPDLVNNLRVLTSYQPAPSKLQKPTMPSRTRLASCIAAAILLASTALIASSKPKPARAPAIELHPEDVAYLNGKLVRWIPTSGGPRQKLLHAGPWLIGARNNDKPRDGRLNVYLVAPGTQWHSEKAPQFNHNLVINALPRESESSAEWDAYLAVVLDPSLNLDVRSERELILARQQSFTPADDYAFNNIPGAAFLREFLKFQTVSDLEGFRRHDGSLPRLVLVPIKAMVRATATEIPPPTEAADSQTETKNDSQPVPPPSSIKPEKLPDGSSKDKQSSGSTTDPK